MNSSQAKQIAGDPPCAVTAQENSLNRDMETMAALDAMERLAQSGSGAVPQLLAHVAGTHPLLADAAMRWLFALVPRAALPNRWPLEEGGAAAAAGTACKHAYEHTIPAWIGDNPLNQEAHAGFASLCLQQMRQLPEQQSRLHFVRQLAVLAGAREELAVRFDAEGYSPEAAELRRSSLELAARQYPRQVSFSPTMYCQLHCPYCIAGADSPQSAEREADAGQVEALLAWMARHRLTRLGLTGGEPSRYSRFPQLLARLHQAGMEYYMASNGLLEEEALAAIFAYSPLCLTLHLTPEVLHSGLLSHFIATARRLRQAGIYAILRCNFTKSVEDPLVFLDVAQDCAIRELRIAIPMPNSQRGNRFVDIGQLAAFAPLLHKLVSRAQERRMSIQLSKPFPMCFMSESVAWHFLKNGSLACVCPSYITEFSNNLVVYPDLHFSACLGLNRRSPMPITACDGPEAAAHVFAGDISQRMHSPLMAQCRDCPLGLRGQCIGACLSYRQEPEPSALVAPSWS